MPEKFPHIFSAPKHKSYCIALMALYLIEGGQKSAVNNQNACLLNVRGCATCPVMEINSIDSAIKSDTYKNIKSVVDNF